MTSTTSAAHAASEGPPAWARIAAGEIGIQETAGAASNPHVLAYYADAGHPGVAEDAIAWCAAFVGACLERAGVASTKSLLARSYLDWGQPLALARLGAIAVLSRGGNPAFGHVGFLIGEAADRLFLLGGNQSNQVSIEAFPRARLLGLRWPADVALPAGLAFERALPHVLEMEGGWSDDPYDPGGPTNQGITLAVFADDRQVEVTAANIAALKDELSAIAPATVERIYRTRYWKPALCAELPAPIALMHFDAAVNHGVGTAARLLQDALGVEIDGEIGPLTLEAAAARPAAAVLDRYAEIRRDRYRGLSHFWRFGRGWLARVDQTLAAASALIRLPETSSPSQGASPMNQTSTTQSKSEASTKWWGQSMTIWGTLITALSTVLPVLGPLTGLDITPELVRQAGDQAVLAVQAVGGLVGIVMTIYGRTRASARLERREVKLHL